MIKERPILFSDHMVRSILEGRQTQTRRTLDPQPDGGIQFSSFASHGVLNGKGDNLICRFGKKGDRLWVRESFCYDTDLDEYFYRSDGELCVKWKPSIHMPRSASRILLEINDVRVERLQNISEEDAIAEGLKALTKDGKTIKYGIPDRDGYPGNDNLGWHWCDWNVSPVIAYKRLWESMGNQIPWVWNPWVWVIKFRKI